MRRSATAVLRAALVGWCAWAAGCAVRPATPEPPPVPLNIRAVPPAFPEELISRRRASSVTMRIYNTGWIRTHGGVVSSMKSWDAKVRLDAPVFLIKHPTQGYILFDTGLSTATVEKMGQGFFANLFIRYQSQPGQDIASQLKADGVDPAEVRWVILSHLHLDHADRADDFHQATVVVSRDEWTSQMLEQARRHDSAAFDPASHEGRWKLDLIDLSTAPPWAAFDHGTDLFSDGSIYLVALPGHTAGSLGAWVNLDGGPVLLAGGAASVIDNYMDLALPCERVIADLRAYWRSLNIIKTMQNALPRLVVFPGHDLSPRSISTRDDLPLVPFPKKPS